MYMTIYIYFENDFKHVHVYLGTLGPRGMPGPSSPLQPVQSVVGQQFQPVTHHQQYQPHNYQGGVANRHGVLGNHHGNGFISADGPVQRPAVRVCPCHYEVKLDFISEQNDRIKVHDNYCITVEPRNKGPLFSLVERSSLSQRSNNKVLAWG